MGMDENEPTESQLSSSAGPQPTSPGLTLEKAIEMGEYDPEYLGQFPQWHQYSVHLQFELIKNGLANRRRQLLTQWMEIERANDFSKKSHLQEASKSIMKQLDKLTKDKERLYTKYSIEMA